MKEEELQEFIQKHREKMEEFYQQLIDWVREKEPNPLEGLQGLVSQWKIPDEIKASERNTLD